MKKYIDLDLLTQQINDECKYAIATNDYQRGCNAVCDWVVKIINNIPCADVLPLCEVQHWKSIANNYQTLWCQAEAECLFFNSVIESIQNEIDCALDSNYKVLNEHANKNNSVINELVIRVKGKIDALRGIYDFLDDIIGVKK